MVSTESCTTTVLHAGLWRSGSWRNSRGDPRLHDDRRREWWESSAGPGAGKSTPLRLINRFQQKQPCHFRAPKGPEPIQGRIVATSATAAPPPQSGAVAVKEKDKLPRIAARGSNGRGDLAGVAGQIAALHACDEGAPASHSEG